MATTKQIRRGQRLVVKDRWHPANEPERIETVVEIERQEKTGWRATNLRNGQSVLVPEADVLRRATRQDLLAFE